MLERVAELAQGGEHGAGDGPVVAAGGEEVGDAVAVLAEPFRGERGPGPVGEGDEVEAVAPRGDDRGGVGARARARRGSPRSRGSSKSRSKPSSRTSKRGTSSFASKSEAVAPVAPSSQARRRVMKRGTSSPRKSVRTPGMSPSSSRSRWTSATSAGFERTGTGPPRWTSRSLTTRAQGGEPYTTTGITVSRCGSSVAPISTRGLKDFATGGSGPRTSTSIFSWSAGTVSTASSITSAAGTTRVWGRSSHATPSTEARPDGAHHVAAARDAARDGGGHRGVAQEAEREALGVPVEHRAREDGVGDHADRVVADAHVRALHERGEDGGEAIGRDRVAAADGGDAVEREVDVARVELGAALHEGHRERGDGAVGGDELARTAEQTGRAGEAVADGGARGGGARAGLAGAEGVGDGEGGGDDVRAGSAPPQSQAHSSPSG